MSFEIEIFNTWQNWAFNWTALVKLVAEKPICDNPTKVSSEFLYWRKGMLSEVLLVHLLKIQFTVSLNVKPSNRSLV